MSTYGLTDTGLVLPRAADLRADFQTRVGVELAARGQSVTIDWDRDTVWGTIAVVVSEMEAEPYEILQAIYDARSENNATGQTLADLGALVGVEWSLATYGSVSLDLTGTPGTVIAAGKLVRDSARVTWAIADSVTLDGAGEGTTTATCATAGEINAAPQTWTILTPVSGWTSAVSTTAAVPGRDQQTAADFRRSRREQMSRGGGSSRAALRALILGVDGVTDCVVLSNPESTTQTVSGVSMAPNSVAIIVYPDTLTDAQKTALVKVIDANVWAGTQTNGDQTATVTTAGLSLSYSWAWATETTVRVRLTDVAVADGYDVTDMLDPVTAVMVTAFDALHVGDGVYALQVGAYLTAAAVPGLLNGVIEFSDDAGATWHSGISVTATVKLVLGTVTVSA